VAFEIGDFPPDPKPFEQGLPAQCVLNQPGKLRDRQKIFSYHGSLPFSQAMTRAGAGCIKFAGPKTGAAPAAPYNKPQPDGYGLLYQKFSPGVSPFFVLPLFFG
jgi:hypothetical protein